MGQELGMAFSRWFWHRLSHEVTIEMSSESLTGTGGCASKMTHLYAFWLEASVPYYVDLYIGRPENLYMSAGFFQSK